MTNNLLRAASGVGCLDGGAKHSRPGGNSSQCGRTHSSREKQAEKKKVDGGGYLFISCSLVFFLSRETPYYYSRKP